MKGDDSLVPLGPVAWSADWAWGMPLIVVVVIIHVLGLLLISEKVERLRQHISGRYSDDTVFVSVIGTTALLATGLHWAEAMLWGIAYLALGALPTYSSAVLYSLNAMTSFGHTSLVLERRWQLMGALEALNGMLLFGLTTATLFAIIQKARELHRKSSL